MPDSNESYDHARQKAIDQLKRSRQSSPSVEALANEILHGSYKALSAGITLVESQHAGQYKRGQELVSVLYPHSGKALRVGITGVPGVGKSTFIESFGSYLIERGKRVAVLAVDPSSQKSRGSILGDKTRMEQLSANPKAFIRPTPAAEALGGVARSTREAMVLCEAAGFDSILVETVGVGQSETAVHSMTDFFLLLMLAGAGDELQGIKRGIMEMADAIAINKAEGPNRGAAEKARQAYANALHLLPPNPDGWIPQVMTCSALKNEGLDTIWETIDRHRNKMILSGQREIKRKEQALFWFETTLNDLWHRALDRNAAVRERKQALKEAIRAGEVSPFQAASELVDMLG